MIFPGAVCCVGEVYRQAEASEASQAAEVFAPPEFVLVAGLSESEAPTGLPALWDRFILAA
jgi:hypothetical protein